MPWSGRFPAAGSTSTRRSVWWPKRVSVGSARPVSRATARMGATSPRSSACSRVEADRRRAEIALVDDAARLSLKIDVALHTSGVATFQASISNEGDIVVHARCPSAQPSRACAGAGVVDRRRPVDQRVRPDPHAVDRQLPDDREPTRQDVARAPRRSLRRHAGMVPMPSSLLVRVTRPVARELHFDVVGADGGAVIRDGVLTL